MFIRPFLNAWSKQLNWKSHTFYHAVFYGFQLSTSCTNALSIDYRFLMTIAYEILEVFLLLVSMGIKKVCLYFIVNGNCTPKYDKTKYISKLLK